MKHEPNHFRLVLKTAAPCAVFFDSTRNGFRSALASAVIDCRLMDRRAPLMPQIALAGANSKDPKDWAGLPKDIFPERNLPETLRWEDASYLYDHLVKRKDTLLASAHKNVQPVAL